MSDEIREMSANGPPWTTDRTWAERMLNARASALVLGTIIVIGLLLPLIFAFSSSCDILQRLHWYKDNWVGIVTLVVLAITAWGLIVYAADVHEQTRNLSKVTIHPDLPTNTPIPLPDLSMNTFFVVSNPSGKALNVRVKLKIWVGSYRVKYSGGGLYDGAKTWLMTAGQFTGVVGLGQVIRECIKSKIGGTINILGFLDTDNEELADEYRELNIAERIRARIFVKHSEYADETGRKVEGQSYMFYLQPTRSTTKDADGNICTIPAVVWVPDVMQERYPPDAFRFEDEDEEMDIET